MFLRTTPKPSAERCPIHPPPKGVEVVFSDVNIKTPRRGFTTGAVMVSIMACFLIIMGLMLTASTQMNLTRRNTGKVRATLLAEAGVDASLIVLTSNWNATTSSGSLYDNPGANQLRNGDFSSVISIIDGSHRKVISTGTEFTGSTSTVVAIVNKEDSFISNYAMLSNGNISINGTVDVETLPSSQHSANIHSNQNISFGSNSTVDGTLMAVGSISGGTGYFPNQPGSDTVPFPDATQINTWRTDWTIEAQSAGHSYNGTSLFPGNKASLTIQAPAYINGDVSLSNTQTLILQGPGVVWINGNVRLTAQSTLDNRALLAINGNFSQVGQSLYKTGSNGTDTPTLVAFTGDSDIAGGGIAQGIVYSVSGNLKVTGNSAFIGSLVAGGDITAGGTYNQYYPTNQSSRVAFISPPHVEKIVEL